MDSHEADLRAAVCDVARRLYERGHNAPGDGNLSVRLGGGFLTTPSGVHKGRLRPEDLVELDHAGHPRRPGAKPSSELRMHLAIYAARVDVAAIAHAHSPHAVALTVAAVSLDDPPVPEAILAFGGIPTIPYATPTTADVPRAILAVAAEKDAFLLERHGTVCLGRDIEEAFARIEIVEHTAKIAVLAKMMGRLSGLPADEVAKLRAMAASFGM